MDFSLVSNESLSKGHLTVWGQGQMKWAQKGLKHLHLCCHSQKIETQNQKLFFH